MHSKEKKIRPFSYRQGMRVPIYILCTLTVLLRARLVSEWGYRAAESGKRGPVLSRVELHPPPSGWLWSNYLRNNGPSSPGNGYLSPHSSSPRSHQPTIHAQLLSLPSALTEMFHHPECRPRFKIEITENSTFSLPLFVCEALKSEFFPLWMCTLWKLIWVEKPARPTATSFSQRCSFLSPLNYLGRAVEKVRLVSGWLAGADKRANYGTNFSLSKPTTSLMTSQRTYSLLWKVAVWDIPRLEGIVAHFRKW